jgi:hypothetical protein
MTWLLHAVGEWSLEIGCVSNPHSLVKISNTASSLDALRQKIVKRRTDYFVYAGDNGKIRGNGMVVRELLHGAN